MKKLPKIGDWVIAKEGNYTLFGWVTNITEDCGYIDIHIFTQKVYKNGNLDIKSELLNTVVEFDSNFVKIDNSITLNQRIEELKVLVDISLDIESEKMFYETSLQLKSMLEYAETLKPSKV